MIWGRDLDGAGGMTGRTPEPKVKQGGSTGTDVLARLVRFFQFQFCSKDSLAFPSHIPGWLLPSSPVLSGRCWDGFFLWKAAASVPPKSLWLPRSVGSWLAHIPESLARWSSQDWQVHVPRAEGQLLCFKKAFYKCSGPRCQRRTQHQFLGKLFLLPKSSQRPFGRQLT